MFDPENIRPVTLEESIVIEPGGIVYDGADPSTVYVCDTSEDRAFVINALLEDSAARDGEGA